ncbi:DUF3883 domain-containing protein [Pseudomarimonas arenosa]|uniref:DUF3883 domain-containing protein n=1 Tax=Pseudomarimonas arenosa TaxID=2774145 RepID=A0AAW3ZQM9_9GAMM|nr:DUF3883 domain-containing protein [Pseudomarimonas arenosa]MBD8526897.1 DUF3883 domain-containing protein [Pseudomarimonas arenosa]
MATGSNWSRIEVEACVADYLRMLSYELNGQRYSKTEHAKALLQKLRGRSRASLEFKHCNISAVMIEFGYPYIAGYKPRSNYQALLGDIVEAQLATNHGVQDAVQSAVERPAVEVAVADIGAVWMSPPKSARVHEPQARYNARPSMAQRDYLAREARNQSLGRAGELFVLEVEAQRLHAAGRKSLSERVEHVAATRGDGLGFDVLSFEEDGRERLIEVKTTAFGELTPFFVSHNELLRSEADAAQYQLYRVFNFRDKPRLFNLPGAITTHCRLNAVSYLARLCE